MILAELKIKNEAVSLRVQKDADGEDCYCLTDESNTCRVKIKLTGREFEIIYRDETITNTEEELKAKLSQLILDIIELEQSGTDITEHSSDRVINPYNPDDIKVSSKQFSIKLIKDMADSGDLILNPDFQRHSVWDRRRRSLLIESVLLRIPLPMFYFSEDKEGKLTVVDGLQRLSAIIDFMNNKFPLKDLEYLQDSCEDKYYRTLEPKYARWFNLTQLSGNVIDPSSPFKVKYDIFRRINTGGKPLNNQEIRNCLAGEGLRQTLRKMASLPEFKKATDGSIQSIRMEDEEMALRFILFRRLNKKIDEYTGYMDLSLDNLTEELQKSTMDDLTHYVKDFSIAMNNADYLFGSRYAFRKVRLKDIEPKAYKQLINKALFVSWSVLLADYETEKVQRLNKRKSLLKPEAKTIESDTQLWSYLSYGTNGKANIQYAFSCVDKIIHEHLRY
ncbi:MAG: DUF262 domain-containing protein [Tannerellaceae bacterium]|jgi:hypothetical protein|nr:DUF262 domain-containing protein [Tannerellaceae bacterium]